MSLPKKRKTSGSSSTAMDLDQNAPPRTVCICGGGILGASTLYALIHHPSWRPGVDSVTLIEAHELASAASGKAGGFLASDWHSKETTALADLSFKIHCELAEKHDGQSWGFRRIETYSVSFDETRRQAIEKSGKRKAVGEVHWLDASMITKVSRLGGMKQTAQVTPKLFTRRLVELSQERGAQVVYATVNGLLFAEDRTTLQGLTAQPPHGSPSITIPCNEFVIAAGPWSGQLAKRILPPSAKPVAITGQRGHSIILRPERPLTATAVFCRLYAGGEMSDPEIYARPDGTAYLCGATDDEPMPETAEQVQVASNHIRTLIDHASAISPHDLGTAQLVAAQACYLPMSERGAPLVGQLTDHIWINAGHTCWGITLGPGSGQILAEMMLEGAPRSCDVRDLIP